MTYSLLAGFLLAAAPADAAKHFAITVVDADTGRGVPLVELRTVHGVRHYTDSNGVVAFHEPGLEGQDVFFYVQSHGYEYPKDGFGIRGKILRVEPGGQAKLTVKRLNIAERLYRVTGAGIYRDSLLVGARVPLREPLLNSLVLGSDSVLNAVYRGKLYWFWGDTNQARYPLGNFYVTGAVSELPGRGGLDPARGVDLIYFVDKKGFARPMTQVPGKGPTWLTGVVTLPDKNGRERLYGSYCKVEPPLKVYARGLAVYDDDKELFEPAVDIDPETYFNHGQTFRHTDHGVDYVYFAHPFPLTRVPARGEAFLTPEAYEVYTCLLPGSTLQQPCFDRSDDGRLRYAWRKGAPALGPIDEARLIKDGTLQERDARWLLRQRGSDSKVALHAGSVAWNEYRRRWIMIAVELGGTSMLGEVWYAEAEDLLGPWSDAVKVVSHERYSFYNPKQHPVFDQDGGRFIYFEGTYTHTFSGNPEQTPRYDYNQMMYRLDLSDPRLR
jgi:hypothetical protein